MSAEPTPKDMSQAQVDMRHDVLGLRKDQEEMRVESRKDQEAARAEFRQDMEEMGQAPQERRGGYSEAGTGASTSASICSSDRWWPSIPESLRSTRGSRWASRESRLPLT